MTDKPKWTVDITQSSRRGRNRFVICKDGAIKGNTPSNVAFKSPEEAMSAGWEIVNAGQGEARERGYRAGYDEGKATGDKAGYARGNMDGRQDGTTEGIKKGRISGYQEGRAEGRTSGIRSGMIFGILCGAAAVFVFVAIRASQLIS